MMMEKEEEEKGEEEAQLSLFRERLLPTTTRHPTHSLTQSEEEQSRLTSHLWKFGRRLHDHHHHNPMLMA